MGDRFLTAVRGTKPALTAVTGMSVVIVLALILANQLVNVGAIACFAASANVIGIGVAFVSAQLFAAYLIFNESFQVPQWLGTAFVFVGVALVAVGHRGGSARRLRRYLHTHGAQRRHERRAWTALAGSPSAARAVAG